MTEISPPFHVQLYASQMLSSQEKYRVEKGGLKPGLRETFTGWSGEQGSKIFSLPTHTRNSLGGKACRRQQLRGRLEVP